MATQQQVTQFYQEILGRAPDAGGLAHYMRYSNPEAIRQEMLGSAEYRTRQSASRPAPVNSSTALTSFAKQNQANWDALLNRQKKEQDSLFGKYTKAMQGQEKLPALYTRLSSELDIPGLSQGVQGFKNEIYRVQGLLDRLDEDVTSRNLGTYTTEAMRNRIMQKEGTQMRTDLGRLGTGMAPLADMLTGAQGTLQTLLPLHMEQQDRELRPLELQINSLSDRFAREITGYTKSKEVELTGILDKLERERFLADREWEKAEKLAAEAREFERSKKLASMAYTSAYGGGGGGSPAPAPVYNPVPRLPAVQAQPLRVSVATPGKISSVGVAKPGKISGVSVATPRQRITF